MSSIKDLFGKNTSNKIITNSSVAEVGNPIESANFVKAKVAEIQKFVPNVNFATASNFAVYGLAEDYYAASINYILAEYPYDGSRSERINWELDGVNLDKYFFDNLYPRTNGYVNIGEDYGSVITVPGAGGFYEYSPEYIKFFGGPNGADGYDGSQKISKYFTDSNVYASGSRQESNIELDGNKGFSVEFWLKKDSWQAPPTESRSQVIVDLWNSSSANPGRLTIWADRSSPNNFFVEVASGSTTEYISALGSNLPIIESSWNHYALTFGNNGNDLQSKVYLNGVLNDTYDSTGKAINKVTGSMFGYVGALTTATTVLGQGGPAYGKLSGSLDDFRIWKTQRLDKDIQQNWFTNVYGGTNTDYQLSVSSSYKYDLSKNVDLGVYFKFNEGIIDTTAINSQDAVVLDYAGRSSNGTWTGYTLQSRETGSAMVLSKAATSEFKDPIVYATNPLVVSLKQEYENKGKLHDAENNSALYWSLPSWITSDDQNKSNSALKQLTQIMGSYFDTLQSQIKSVNEIKDRSYLSGNVKPPTFANRLLDNKGLISDEILSNATDLEYLASRSDKLNFEKKLEDTKNLIYLNIYNNLIDIFKSKGTEKGFRNLIRCFGIDDNIVNLNLYGNNTEYDLLSNTKNSIVRKRYVDFFAPERFGATVYQSSSSDVNTRSFISSSNYAKYHGNTYECEAFFPPNASPSITNSYSSTFLSASIFGCHTSGSGDNWGSPDTSNFQVYAVRENLKRDSAYFVLTGTAGGYFPELTSSAYQDVYKDSKWNLSVRVYPSASFAGSITGSGEQDYVVRFTGYQYVVDNLMNSFDVTGAISSTNAQAFLTGNKRFYMGAHRTNFTDSVLQNSNAQISSLRVWADKLNNNTLKTHAQQALNFGSENPYKNAFLAQSGSTLGQNTVQIPEMETLALNWDFDTVTGSNSSGNFIVQDFSSGSVALANRWGWLGDISKYQHTGVGYGFPANSTEAIKRKHVNTLVQKAPEVIDSANMISLISDEENQIFQRDSRPIEYFFAFEKSMYNVISQEILKVFSTIIDFNNLIGEPVNRYRQDYKQLEKLRELYFEGVENNPDFDHFVEYYKWIDSSIGSMLQQLAPASANFYNGLNNLVESHVLERNKYWTKFPTLEMEQSQPIEGLQGQGASSYPVAGFSLDISSPPNPNTSTVWYEKRLERTNPLISSGDPEVDSAREKIRQIVNQFVSSSGDTFVVSRDSTATTTTYQGNTYAKRNFSKLVDLKIDDNPVLKGGSNFSTSKRLGYTSNTLKFDSSVTLDITASSFEGQAPRVILSSTKTQLNPKLKNSEDIDGYISAKSTILAPFSLYSSSVAAGYVANVANNFRNSTEVNNYHDDSYGDDHGTPLQGPFTRQHVGGRQYRHVDLNKGAVDVSKTRPEGWNLELSASSLSLSSRTAVQPRATMLRDMTAKRPLNIANIKWGTSSANIGNFREGYEILQTSNRTLNNRYFIATNGEVPANASSSYVKDLFDYELPRYDLTGTNKNIFVERFSAPGGPETTAGGLNVFGGEYSVYNTINYRNLTVRRSLNTWAKDHSGQFGIKSGSSVSAAGYNTLASYYKVNRNPKLEIHQASDPICNVSTFFNSSSILKAANASGQNWIGSGPDQPHLRVTPVSSSAPFASDGTAGLAVSMWFTTTSSYYRDRVLMSRWTSDAATTTLGESDWRIYIPANSSSAVNFEMVDSVGSTIKLSNHTSSVITDSNWHHLLATYVRNGSGPTYDWDMSVAIDGGYKFTYSFSGVNNETTTTARTYIGAQYDDNAGAYPKEATLGFGEGQIDEVAIWYGTDSPPGPSERALLYNSGCPTNLNRTDGIVPPTSWWRMGDGTGDITPSSTTVTGSITDLNGSNNAEVWLPEYVQITASAPTPCSSVTYSSCTGATYNCSFEYDNWWVQHAIPRSDYQYSWITASTTKPPCDTTGHLMGFDVPFGSLSVTQSSLPFITASSWGSFINSGDCDGATGRWWGIDSAFAADHRSHFPSFTPENFAGINFHIYEPVSSSTNTLGYPSHIPLVKDSNTLPCLVLPISYLNTDMVDSLSGTLGPVTYPEHLYTAQTFNSLMLHRNGPYQYPSWKQIRTGETPIPRYHKKNNILSVLPQAKVVYLPSGDGTGRPAHYIPKSPTPIQNFYEPVVEFKYRALETVSPRTLSTLKHSYGNNLGLFSQRGFGSQSVGTVLGIGDTKETTQAYDKLKLIDGAIGSLSYNEVVYPRSVNAGFAKTKQRLNYAELAATRGFNNVNNFAPIINTGSNGIDRGPLERRTYWRDSYINRNRRQRTYRGASIHGSMPYIESSLYNSQNILDGFATSIYGLGSTPMLISSGNYSTTIGVGTNYTFTGSLGPGSFLPVSIGSGLSEEHTGPFLDFGELNSANYLTIASLYGNSYGSSAGYALPASPTRLAVLYPTASAYYYHFELQKDNVNNLSGATFGVYNPGILRWQTPELSGKKPWFDTYEDYSLDISKYAKSFSILPEFKMSANMPYYTKSGGFKSKNNKFLSLDGANITSSAITETGSPNEEFFVEYSNSDFKAHFGSFADDMGQPTQISLKCGAVKKLLPYNGFYPQQRTLQLASQLSQSVAPFISGYKWTTGSATDPAQPKSGSLAVQSLLQPYFAPGIMYNTIKSGIAVDWAAHTSSAPNLLTSSGGEGFGFDNCSNTAYINSGSDYRIPFESIMDPLGGNFIPISSSVNDDRLYLQNPSFQQFNAPFAELSGSGLKYPYVNIRDTDRASAQKQGSDYELYKLASNNFFAEVPNFFLNNGESGKLKSITSDVLEKDVTLESGSVYFMDIALYKDEDLVMIEDYANGSRQISVRNGSGPTSDGFNILTQSNVPQEPLFPGDIYRSYNGRFFGPPVRAHVSGSTDQDANPYGAYREKWGINDNYITDPGFAPYTPPYFYGKSIATIRYVADAEDEILGGFSFDKMKNKCLRGVQDSGLYYYNPELDQAFNKLGSSNPINNGTGIYSSERSPADADRMNISASVELFGILPVPEVRLDDNNNLSQEVSTFTAGSNKLLICPKMETPVLNFVNQPVSSQRWLDTSKVGSAGATQAGFVSTAKGLWGGYGEIPTSSSISFAVEKTKLDPKRDNPLPNNKLNSLVDVLFNGKEKQERVGEIKQQKIISEAIVAIPFVQNSYSSRSKFATTVSIMDNKNFFKINKTVFNKFKNHYIKNRTNPDKVLLQDGQSIQVMIERMSQYVMPPQLDFLNNTEITPFASYIFEFKAKLDQQDLADIWQGLMPKISTTAEIPNLEVDKDNFGLPSNEFTHQTGKNEFYGGKELPCDVRWMVFKVKKRANYDYNSIRPDFNTSTLVPNDRTVKNGALLKQPYSYNWPYDYFSLVELAQLEVEDGFTLSPGSGSVGAGTTPRFNFLGGGS